MSVPHHLVSSLSPTRSIILDWCGLTNGTPFMRANGVSYPDFGSMVAAGKATFSRTGAGTAIDRFGSIIQFATGIPRESNGGMLIEEARTNLALGSFDTANSMWVVVASLKTTGQSDPSGGAAASVVVADGVNTLHYSQAAGVSFLSGATYTFSRIVKAGTQTFLQFIGQTSIFGTGQYANFNLLGNGWVTASTGLAGNGAVITPMANGWYRISISIIAINTGSGSGGSLIFISSATDIRLPVNNLQTSFYDFGAQVEAGTFVSSVIITTNSAATRGAEAATLNLPPSFSNVTVDYGVSGRVVIPRDSLSNPAVFDFGSASGGPWVNNYIKRIVVA